MDKIVLVFMFLLGACSPEVVLLSRDAEWPVATGCANTQLTVPVVEVDPYGEYAQFGLGAGRVAPGEEVVIHFTCDQELIHLAVGKLVGIEQYGQNMLLRIEVYKTPLANRR